MAQGSLVREQIDAAARFLREFEKHVPIKVAFWLKSSEEGRWHLYIVSDRITDDNLYDRYGDVAQVAVSFDDPWFDPMQVKLVAADDPLAKAAGDLRRRYPGYGSLPIRDRVFGGVEVEEGYVYPSPIPALT